MKFYHHISKNSFFFIFAKSIKEINNHILLFVIETEILPTLKNKKNVCQFSFLRFSSFQVK